MERKVWVSGYVSSSLDGSPDVYVESHWETLSGTEAEVNAIYSGSRYQGMKVHKKVSEPGTFGGRYEHNTFNQGNVANVIEENRANDKNTDNWEDNS